jgi:hypothetical protein
MVFMREDVAKLSEDELRDLLVSVALVWEDKFVVAPKITGDLAEFDAARLVGGSLRNGEGHMKGDTAVMRGFDFRKGGERYQVKSNRPSGKLGSKVTLVGKATNYEWDKLIWILYDREYQIVEAWEFTMDKYRQLFELKKRLSPDDMRQGRNLMKT